MQKGLYYCFECGAGGLLKDIGIELTKEQQRLSDKHKPLPPKSSLDRFWGYCTQVPKSSEAFQYCASRFGRSDFELSQDMVRRLPDFTLETEEIKGWFNKYKLVFPLCDDAGNMRNVIARSVAKSPKIKSMSLRGYTRNGLCMALLRDEQKVIICEGEMDWLAWCLFGPQDATVYGIFNGSVPSKGASFVEYHRYADVLIATDLDEAGDKYAEQIIGRLHSSCSYTRWAPQMKRINDACDLLKKGGTLEWEGLL